MNNRFSACQTIKEAKLLYHQLLKSNHPDLGGSEEETKRIVSEFEDYCRFYMSSAFDDFNENSEFNAKGNSRVFGDILAKACEFNCRIEIIGYWIYAFESYEVRNQLKNLGFFFSKKHKAWIYNGGKKRRVYSRLTTDKIRSIHGSELIREKEEASQIAAH